MSKGFAGAANHPAPDERLKAGQDTLRLNGGRRMRLKGSQSGLWTHGEGKPARGCHGRGPARPASPVSSNPQGIDPARITRQATELLANR